MMMASPTAASAAAQAASAFEPVLPGLLLLLPLVGFAVNGAWAFARPGDRTVPSLVGPGVVLAAFGVAAANFLAMHGAAPHEPAVVSYWTWMSVGGLEVGVDLQLDQLSVLMALVVTGVGSLIHVYSVGYMRDDPGYARYYAYLNLFVFFMLVLVTGANLPLTFVGWEGVGLCSYLLIGFWYETEAYADAGKKAFVVNRIGDFGFLMAMFLVFSVFGTLDYAALVEAAPAELAYGGITATLITLFLFLACVGKSAQIPLHVWLPDAMAGPTPVSALIHAATMVTAGVYLVARTGVLFALAPMTQALVAAVGAGTALFAATVATQQTDIKKVLAYSTVSQLGYMFLGVGVGAFTAGIFHLVTHAFFKALLFLGAGAVIHAMHHAFHETGRHADPNDMRNHGGLRRWMPVTWATMWAATLAIAGVFPFAGFFSKDEIIWEAGTLGYPLLWGVALMAAVLTAGYMARLMYLTFHGENRTGEAERQHLHEVPAVMWVPLAALGLLSLVGGWIQIPEALPLPRVDALHHWLEPVFAPALAVMEEHGLSHARAAPLGGGEATWAAVSTILAAAAIASVWAFLSGRRQPAADEAPEPAGLARVLRRAWYVDELYDRLVVRPSLALWRACWRVVDAGLVDGTIDRLASGSRALGWLGGRAQTGRVGAYVVVFLLGVLALLGALVL
jgi:NADH-quinone oxidoreductase subunit L